MSASNVGNAAAPRKIVCETSDSDQIPVDLDVLRVSGTYKDMCDDLGLEEHEVFPVKNVSTRIFKKVIDWCEEHKDDPEPVIEKDPLTQECVWFTLTDYDKNFFDVPMSELLELIKAATYLDIPRLYQYACQSIAAWIKGKRPREICEVLRQDCDLQYAQIHEVLDENPWLVWPGFLPCAPIEDTIFIPNEVLVTIFEKLSREDLERLQLVCTQFNEVIVSSSELSAQQGPLRVVTKVEFGAYSEGHFSQKIEVCLRDGRVFTCTDCVKLAKRLKFAKVQNLRFGDGYRGVFYADVQELAVLLPVKSAWENATLEASVQCFPSEAQVEFAFTQLFLCKEIILDGKPHSFSWSRAFMRLPAIAACSKLDFRELINCGIQPADVVEWMEHEDRPGRKWSEPRQIVLHELGIIGGIDGLLTTLKTTFSASDRPNPYFVRIIRWSHRGSMNEAIANEQTHERLRIRAGQTGAVIVERA